MAGSTRTKNKKPPRPEKTARELLAVVTQLCEYLQELRKDLAKQKLGSPHLSITQAANYLGITSDTLKRKMKHGELPFHHRPGTATYFLKHELNQWLSDPRTLVAGPSGDKKLEDHHVAKATKSLDEQTIRQLLEKNAEFPATGENEN